MSIRVLLVGFVGMMCASSACAETAYAVLVGIDDYPDAGIVDRTECQRCVTELHGLLADPKRGGVPKGNAHLLVGKKATRRAILEAVREVVAKAKSEDRVFFAFFGQGSTRSAFGDHRCYFAVDSTAKGRDRDAIDAGELREIFDRLESRRFAAFVDVPFTGLAKPTWGTPAPLVEDEPSRELLGDDPVRVGQPMLGRVVFRARYGMSGVDKGDDPGTFGKVLLEGLSGQADEFGEEADGSITVDELSAYFDDEMPMKTKRSMWLSHKVVRVGVGVRENHFGIVGHPRGRALVERRLAKFVSMLKEGMVPLKYADEGQTLLGGMPRLRVRRALRGCYVGLVRGSITLAQFENARKALLATTVLPRVDALWFAGNVMRGIDTLETNYVEEVSAASMVGWAVRGLYSRIGERMPDAIGRRLRNADALTEAQLSALVTDARVALGKREDLADGRDLTMALEELARQFDKHTVYVSPETVASFPCILSSFVGVGVECRKDLATGLLMVVNVVVGSPAHKAGIRANDLIETIISSGTRRGKPYKKPFEYHTKELELWRASSRLVGDRGTKVKVVIRRQGVAKPIRVSLVRGWEYRSVSVVGVRRVPGQVEWDHWIDENEKIGYVRFTEFGRNTVRDFRRIVQGLAKQELRGLVIDLRFNSGGLLSQGVEVADSLLPKGDIGSIRPRVGQRDDSRAKLGNEVSSVPVVVLVNEVTASVCEILASALQDHSRAWIVGERTAGKGSVQNVQPLAGGALKLTTAAFWTPSGRNLNHGPRWLRYDGWGVTPDTVVTLTSRERLEVHESLRLREVVLAKGQPPRVEPMTRDRQLEVALEHLRARLAKGM